jgi:hypothetical protein
MAGLCTAGRLAPQRYPIQGLVQILEQKFERFYAHNSTVRYLYKIHPIYVCLRFVRKWVTWRD